MSGAEVPPGLFDFPKLESRHLADARLFADRADMARHFARPGGAVAEIGVAMGDFSAVLMEAWRPRRFVAFDMFLMHGEAQIWGRPTAEIFGARTHLQFFRDRFRDAACELVVEEGPSQHRLPPYADASFDLIYVDGDHRPGPVAEDARHAARKVRPDGLLIFNDYIMWDHIAREWYGVVQAVNRLVVAEGWKVAGLALHHHLFCDIALRRP